MAPEAPNGKGYDPSRRDFSRLRGIRELPEDLPLADTQHEGRTQEGVFADPEPVDPLLPDESDEEPLADMFAERRRVDLQHEDDLPLTQVQGIYQSGVVTWLTGSAFNKGIEIDEPGPRS